MTISYTLDVTSSRFSNFARLLIRWHGSIWKSVYKELAAWMVVYTLLSILYRFVLDPEQKKLFEDMVEFCQKHASLFPLTFMLGFFVTIVVQRWWEMFNHFGWIDNVALYVATYINGQDDRAIMIRRNIVRYVVLIEAMVFRDVSPVVRRRFPTDEAFQIAGFLTERERLAMESVASPHGKYWLPIHWSFDLIKQARKTGNIETDRAVGLVQEQIRDFRTGLSKLRAFTWVPIPLAYTQTVFLAVRFFLTLSVVGRQYVDFSTRHIDIKTPSLTNASALAEFIEGALNNTLLQSKIDNVLFGLQIDTYVPLLTILQFIFYLGWMKVAEALLNPYGDDDDDFECNWFIDRNLQVGFSIVDDAIGKEPPMEKDAFWKDTLPTPLYANGARNVPLRHQSITRIDRAASWCRQSLLRRAVHEPNDGGMEVEAKAMKVSLLTETAITNVSEKDGVEKRGIERKATYFDV